MLRQDHLLRGGKHHFPGAAGGQVPPARSPTAREFSRPRQPGRRGSPPTAVFLPVLRPVARPRGRCCQRRSASRG